MLCPALLVVLGSTLEAAGILIVALEIHADGRRARQLANERLGWSRHKKALKRPASWGGVVPGTLGSPEKIQEELYRRDEVLAEVITDGLSGDPRPRVLGVLMLLAGLAVATAGNVWGYA